MQGDQVFRTEDLVEGLVREYLTRNSLAGTLKAFDSERPRGPDSICSRSALRKGLGLERLPAKVNKPQGAVTLELWVLYQQLKLEAVAGGAASSHQQQSAQDPGSPAGATQPVNGSARSLSQLAQSHATNRSTREGFLCDVTQPVQSSVANTPSQSQSQLTATGAAASNFTCNASTVRGPQSSHGSTTYQALSLFTHPALQPAKQHGDLVVQDFEDDLLDMSEATVSSQLHAQSQLYSSRQHHLSPANEHQQTKRQPIPHSQMAEMRHLLFGKEGSSSQLPWPSWKQGFFFCDRAGLSFGLVQRQGGPCGLLAAVQAHVMAAASDSSLDTSLELTAQQQRNLLAMALGAVLWQASDCETATVVCSTQASTSGLSFDQVCHSATQLSCKSTAEVQAALQLHLAQFCEQSGYGMLLLLLSLLLTHGIRRTKCDMDEPDSCFIAAHGYCSQDLVNLVLTGHAVTNCFDGQKDVAGKLCQGVHRRSRLGFLSLFEWFGYTQVGSHLKEPILPIWVVCSESHFTLLYGWDTRTARGMYMLPESAITLMYYDGLANQEQPIRLTLSVALQPNSIAKHDQTDYQQHCSEDALVPPLEHVVHTKWPKAIVTWFGSEPIL